MHSRDIAAFVLAVLSRAAGGETLYSVDYNADQLVLVDTQTGAVTVIGALNRDVFDIDLALLDGQLFASDGHDFYGNPYTDLLVIDPATGAVTSNVRVRFNGAEVYAEGLAAASGQLWIAFDPAPFLASDQLGVVDPSTGAITGVIDYSGFSADMDGAGADASGVVFALDADSTLQSSRLFRTTLIPVGFTQIGGPYGSVGNSMGMHDIVFTPTGAYTIDSYSNRIHRIDPSSGTLASSVALTPSLALLGLERACIAPVVYGTPKINSQGCTPRIGWSGSASASSGAPFLVTASDVLNNKLGLLFYGFAPASQPFQGGTKLVANPVQRTALQSSGGNAPPDDCSGTYSFDMNAHIQSGADPSLAAYADVFCQYWSRDPASPSTTGLTDALRFSICP